jgi:hypothetical protein
MLSPVTGLIPSSPRKRRRLARWALAGIVVCSLAATFVLLPKGTPLPPETFSDEPAQLYVPKKRIELTASERAQISDALERFVQGGLGRHDLEDAWRVTTPSLRAGVTLAEWRKGQVPVTPYQARRGDGRGWQLDWAYPGEASVELFLQPGPREKLGPIAFYAGLKKVRGRWLVDSLQPSATFSRSGEKPRVFSQVDMQRGEVGAGATKGRLGAAWLLLPVALLGLSVLVPIVVLVRKRGR